ILVIEDDRAVQTALKRLFEAEGFAVDIAGNGAAGLEMFRTAAPSVLVLDLSLPGTPGQDVCREISQAAPSLPIVVLSARTEVMDKVLLLELGARDYGDAAVAIAADSADRDFYVWRCESRFHEDGIVAGREAGAADFARVQGAEVHDPKRGARVIA